MKYLNLSGLTYFLNKIKTYLTSSTYLDSIGISNSDIDDIADDAGYSSGSLPASEDIFITGDIIPNTDNTVDLGASSKNIKMIYTKGITINGTQFLPSDYIPRSGGAVLDGQTYSRTVDNSILTINGSSTNDNGAFLRLHGKDYSDTPWAGTVLIRAKNDSNSCDMILKPDGTATWGNKNLAMQEDVIPRSGGAVMTGTRISRVDNTSELCIDGGTGFDKGASIHLSGKDVPDSNERGRIYLHPSNGTIGVNMLLYADGTWTWSGTAVQIGSDARLKQQITQIDNALLDAWEDVNPVQFKYNDAVDQKGDNARLHTGYVVQQIDKACQSHDIDISAYGLYCHEEYPERTEEVTIENEDGTTTKETRVIEPAKEHYSLRYTETLVVECAFLRKKIKELEERLDKLENK